MSESRLSSSPLADALERVDKAQNAPGPEYRVRAKPGELHALRELAEAVRRQMIEGEPAESVSQPSGKLEWHAGGHAWDAHGGYPRHQHSLNGALTIAPGDTEVHFAHGPGFEERS